MRRLPGAPAIAGLEADSGVVIGSLLTVQNGHARIAASIAILRREVALAIGPLAANSARPLGLVADWVCSAGGRRLGVFCKRPYGVMGRSRDVFVVVSEMWVWLWA